MEIRSLNEIALGQTDLILLDLDNTLYVYQQTHQKALAALVDELHKQKGIPRENILDAYSVFRKKINEQHKGFAISHSRLFYIQGIIEHFFHFTDATLINQLYECYWSTFIEAMEVCDDVLPFFNNCIAHQIPVVLVTDMTAEIQFRKITKMQINHYLNFIVSSEEAGAEKPNPVIFNLAIEKVLRIKPLQHITVIGDDRRKDVFESADYLVDHYHITRQ